MINDCLPGDIIRWKYLFYDDKWVNDNDQLWSAKYQKWLPVGDYSTLISKTVENFSFLRKGVLHIASIDDEFAYLLPGQRIYPYSIKTLKLEV